jgi:hypothetical protein
VNAIDRFACLEARLSQHFLGLFQREFRVIPHDDRQQLGSHLRMKSDREDNEFWTPEPLSFWPGG